MSEEIIVEEEIVEIDTAVSPKESSRRLVMAGIGLAVVLRGELSSTFNKIIDQGEHSDQLIPEQNRISKLPIRRTLKKPIKRVLHRFNIPTKSDIDTLNNQIVALIDKVDALQNQPHLPQSTEIEIVPPTEISEEN